MLRRIAFGTCSAAALLGLITLSGPAGSMTVNTGDEADTPSLPALRGDILPPRALLARPVPVSVTTDGGPRFFTIQQVVERMEGKAPVRVSHAVTTAEPRSPAGVGRERHSSEAARSKPFAALGFHTFQSLNASVDRRWQGVQKIWRNEAAEIASCGEGQGACSPAIETFLTIHQASAGLERRQMIRQVNARVNAAITYTADFAQHGEADVWSSPLRSLGGSGDCEDYAIAKYYLLRKLGIADSDLRVILLKDRRAREDHAVLAVRVGDVWKLLDNRFDKIKDDADVPHYRPVYAFNARDQEMFAAPFGAANDIDLELRLGPAGSVLHALNAGL